MNDESGLAALHGVLRVSAAGAKQQATRPIILQEPRAAVKQLHFSDPFLCGAVLSGWRACIRSPPTLQFTGRDSPSRAGEWTMWTRRLNVPIFAVLVAVACPAYVAAQTDP